MKERQCQRILYHRHPTDRDCNKLLFAIVYYFSYALTYLPFFSFKCCDSVVLYIILLEVACESSRLCKMARRSKVVGPRCFKY